MKASILLGHTVVLLTRTMSQKIGLQWNNFQEYVKTAHGILRGDSEFADVTLAFDDGSQIEAHKVILASSSPFFMNLLVRNRHVHPLIYMRGMKSEDLAAIVDFLYYGETTVCQENLESVLSIAEDLKLEGLMVQQNTDEPQSREIDAGPAADKPLEMEIKPAIRRREQVESNSQKPVDLVSRGKPTENIISRDLSQQLDAKVKSMVELSQNRTSNRTRTAYVCKLCGKEGRWVAIRDHIEVKHLEGISIPCSICGNAFRSRCSLRKHRCANKILTRI